MRRQGTGLATAVAVLVAALGAPGPALAGPAFHPATVDDVMDVPVSFPVRNLNRSNFPCLTDGRGYVVRGHLVAPRAPLAGQGTSAVTLYLHGGVVGEPTWRLTAGYDTAVEMAKLGHTSVTIDRLGYGQSGIPPGFESCYGGQADIVHQIIGDLRTGQYQAATPIPAFSRVGVVGHSAGMITAEIEAYSFRDIDALAVGGWGDPGSPSTKFLIELLKAGPPCLRGGDPKRPGGPSGYTYLFKGAERQLLFHDADPNVVAAYIAYHERDPCGDGASIPPAVAFNRLSLAGVTVPVLLFYGADDAVWPAPTPEQQRSLFTGSHDVTLLTLPNTGHMVMLERSAALFRAKLSEWLQSHGL